MLLVTVGRVGECRCRRMLLRKAERVTFAVPLVDE